MKIILFGLGSMGKRRARCLQQLGEHALYGVDIIPERVKAAVTLGIDAKEKLEELPLKEADAYFICTPPDQHETFIHLAREYHKPCFVEASVLLGDLIEIEKEAKQVDRLIAPSCTLCFHPAVKAIKEIIDKQKYGRVINFSYHCGQFLPDWHPWEKVEDFYVSNEATGGCREIVPFELTWLTHCLGIPQNVLACYGSTRDVGAPITDTYAISLEFEKCFGVMLVDVTSRYAIRHLILNFENGQVQWRWDEPLLKCYDAIQNQWQTQALSSQMKHAVGYNENICEEMYIEEVSTFIEAITQKSSFPNTLAKDIAILQLLRAIEKGGRHDILP